MCILLLLLYMTSGLLTAAIFADYDYVYDIYRSWLFYFLAIFLWPIYILMLVLK